MNSSRLRWVFPLFGVLATSSLAVAVDLHNDEPQAAALILLVGGALVGGLWPTGVWRWALLLGVSISIGDYLAPRAGLVTTPATAFNAGALVALVPSFMGTYVGVGIRKLLTGMRP